MSREEKNKISKEKILKASIEEFGENDYFKASTNSICKKSEVSKGLLFHYFKSKDELYLWCVKTCVDELVQYINSNYKGTFEEVEQNLNEYFTLRNVFFKEHPFYGDIIKNTIVNPPKHLNKEIKESKENLINLNKEILNKLLDKLSLRNGIDKESVIKLIFNFSDYLLVNGSEINDEETNKQLIIFIDMLFYGAVKRGEE
ncbi:TetR/AcrR family transcriptional regulator [Clostridium sp.]|uniref:TetR/AcrR family transcriptional regulator n=1 Tax=Clostridium sp. TaxID=1506 RepID=UPI003F359650